MEPLKRIDHRLSQVDLGSRKCPMCEGELLYRFYSYQRRPDVRISAGYKYEIALFHKTNSSCSLQNRYYVGRGIKDRLEMEITLMMFGYCL